MINYVATISSAISGTISLSGSVTFQGTLSELFTNYSGSQVQLITSEYNGVEGNVLFFPQIVEEDSIFDISEIVMIISPNDGVLNHGSSSFSVTDQALFGEDTQIFGQSNTSNQPSIVSTPAGNNAWFFSGSKSFSLTNDLSSEDITWPETGMYSGWFNCAETQGQTLFTCGNGGSYRIAMGTNGFAGLNVWCGSPTVLYGSSSLDGNTWSYYEIVVDGTQDPENRLKLYRDRELLTLDSTYLAWPSTLSTTITTFTFGVNDGYGGFLDGLMGNFYVCNGIPNDQQRNTIMNYQRPVTSSL